MTSLAHQTGQAPQLVCDVFTVFSHKVDCEEAAGRGDLKRLVLWDIINDALESDKGAGAAILSEIFKKNACLRI